MSHKNLILTRLTVILLLAFASSACTGANKPSSTGKNIPVRSYPLRGIIAALPEAPGKSLMIRHEAIHDFVDSFGEQVGMNSMTMPFERLPGVDLSGLKPGDKVALVWVVDWGKNDARITRIEKLPADTPLVFGKAIPEVAPPANK
jgi:Cu/Ag efflux protein CusF